MNSMTVNISFPKQLLKEVDRVAKNEARSRSEMLREAARQYVEHKQRQENDLHLLKLAKPSFEFWNNPEDAVYDSL